ncbi:MAG: hypothetical protein KGQ70_07800, partial [Alphaproteobacteria bacterium]|nr:hypothetical protein [Alphaproteobacteria bacterium]
GGETHMAAHAARVRADNIILYPAQTHYTSAVFEKIAALQDAGEINIAALPLKETAALAAKIARAAALDGAALERVRAAYAPVRAALAEEPPDPVRAVKELVRVLHENSSDADICRAGRLFLDSPKIKSFIADAGLADDPAFRIGARAAEEGRAAKAKLPEGLTP